MFIAYIVLAVLTALISVASGVGKLRKVPQIMEAMRKCEIPDNWLPILAALEFAGAAGLLIGIAWLPLGIAAAFGLTIYFVGAMIAHVRVSDFKGIANPTPLLLIAIAAAVTGSLSL